MKKFIIFVLGLFILTSTTYGLDEGRICETKYSIINGINYFSGIHCTEDIKLTGVVGEKPTLRKVSGRKINDFIIANNHKIVEHIDGSGTCDTLNTITEVQSFENVIYSNNSISYTSTMSSIESLTKEIETLKESYNADDLYNTTFDEMKSRYPLGSLDFLRVETKKAYFDKQLGIKTQVLDKQKEKLTLLYKLTESQKFIEGFYKQLNRVCSNYAKNSTINNNSKEEEEDKNEEDLITKYKEEFNVKLGTKLDKMSRQTLEQLSVKLLSYAETSPVFKRFSDAQRKIVKLKISGLKAAIDDRLK